MGMGMTDFRLVSCQDRKRNMTARLSRIRFGAAMAAILLATGCGGGGTDGESEIVQPDPSVSALFISSTIPASEEADVATDLDIVVTFSDSLSSAGIEEDTIVLRRGDGELVPASVSYQGNTAIIKPTEELSLLTRYTVTIAPGLESVAGEMLEDAYTWDFTTRDGEWSEQAIVDSYFSPREDPIPLGGASLGVGPNGDAIAVWMIGNSVLGAAYRPDGGWSDAQLLESTVGLWSGVVRSGAIVHEMANGELWVSWREKNRPLCGGEPGGLWPEPCPPAISTPEAILVSRYSPANGWGAPELIGGIENRVIESHDIVSDASGRAILVWMQSNEVGVRVRSVHYSPDAGWGDVQELGDGIGGFFAQLWASMDASGQAVVAWTRLGANNGIDLWAVRYSSESWGEPQQISNGDGRVDGTTAVAMDGNGNALLAWEQEDFVPGSRVVWAGVLDTQRQVRIQQMSSNVIRAEELQLMVDTNGNALLAFVSNNGVFGAHYDAASGWGDATKIGTTSMYSDRVALSMNGAGRGLVIWYRAEEDVGSDVWAAAYDPDSGWSGEERVSFSAGEVQPFSVFLTMDEQGNAVAAWGALMAVTDNGMLGNSTWVSRYRWDGSWSSPERLRGGMETAPYTLAASSGGRAQVATISYSPSESANGTEVQFGVFRFE